mgnify:CR=1 FL=1
MAGWRVYIGRREGPKVAVQSACVLTSKQSERCGTSTLDTPIPGKLESKKKL